MLDVVLQSRRLPALRGRRMPRRLIQLYAGLALYGASMALIIRSTLGNMPWRNAMMGHLHNKIVHFPLALGLAAGVMLLAAPRWPSPT